MTKKSSNGLRIMKISFHYYQQRPEWRSVSLNAKSGSWWINDTNAGTFYLSTYSPSFFNANQNTWNFLVELTIFPLLFQRMLLVWLVSFIIVRAVRGYQLSPSLASQPFLMPSGAQYRYSHCHCHRVILSLSHFHSSHPAIPYFMWGSIQVPFASNQDLDNSQYLSIV